MEFFCNSIASLGAWIFSKVTYELLAIFRWKYKTVIANFEFVRNENPTVLLPQISPHTFYKQVLKNLTHDVGEILFKMGPLKKLPENFDDYPCKVGNTIFEIAASSKSVLAKMRCGGIFVTAHYGNYEAMGPWLCRLGIPLKASYIPLKPAWLNHIVESKIRAVHQKSYALQAKTPREFLRLLDQGNLFCLLMDQDNRIPSATENRLLGKSVRTNPLPDFLRRHRPQTLTFICWIEEKGNRKILDAMELPPQGTIADAFNRWLEERIQENPKRWYSWTHRRFYSTHPEIYK